MLGKNWCGVFILIIMDGIWGKLMLTCWVCFERGEVGLRILFQLIPTLGPSTATATDNHHGTRPISVVGDLHDSSHPPSHSRILQSM